MLIDKFIRKKTSAINNSNSNSNSNNKSQTTLLNQQELTNQFQTYPPLLSKLDRQYSSLGLKKPTNVPHHPYHQNQKDHNRFTKSSSTVSFNSSATPASSNTALTSSSSSSKSSSSSSAPGPGPPSSFSSPTPTNETVTASEDRRPNFFNSIYQKPRSLHPSPSSSLLKTPTPSRSTTTTTSTPAPTSPTTATANQTVQFVQLENGDDPTVVLDSTSPIRQQFGLNPAFAQSFPSLANNRCGPHPTAAGQVAIGSDASLQQLPPPNTEFPFRPRASSYHTSASPNQACFPPQPHHSKRPTSLFSGDHPDPLPPPPLPQSFTDSTSTRSFKKIGRRRLIRSKTDTRNPSGGGIATALILSGVSLTPHTTCVGLAGNMQTVSSSTLGSTRAPEEVDDRSVHTTDSHHWTQTASSSNDDQIGTGYAVASRKRNAEFHAIFTSIPDDDYLIEDYGCALQRDILVQGRIYISEQHLCFKANIFGWVTTVVVPFSDVVAIEKRMTALIIPNAIQVITTQSRHTFASFLTRDTAYDLMATIWRIYNPMGMAPSFSLNHEGANLLAGAPGDGVQIEFQDPSAPFSHSSTPAPSKKREHPATQCECSPETHCKELIWDATYPISPEKLYNILFQSDFLKDFWVNEEHLTEIEVGDWTTAPDAKFPSRSVSYIRPLNAPVGPKTIKCIIADEHLAIDFDKYVSIMSTARTPDAPAGGGFCVKTLSCITWQPNNSSRWLVTAGVEWTKVNRFLKSIIESSAISGQKTYQVAVDQALRKHIQLFHSEPGVDRSEIQPTTGANPEEPVWSANNPQNPIVSGRNETGRGGSSQLLRNYSIFRKNPFQAIFNGSHPSWMMMASVGLVVILLVANLMSVKHGNQLAASRMGAVSYPSEAGLLGGVKPQLTGDVAETVKEALQEYFRGHSTSSSAAEQPSEESAIHTSESAQDGSSNPPSEAEEKESFTREEISEIEGLLESLEGRIRNVRKSLVDERRQH